ncbi:MAG: tail fiber domain-containing protein [Chloroflexia bacterium]|nr:tail fiber domain-containing protein [Chloroflexia bacterium]
MIKLRGVTFEWDLQKFPNNGFGKGVQYGLIAQEVEKVLPELVKENAEGYKAVAYDKLTALLIEAIKEQQNEIETLQRKNKELEIQEKKINELEEKIEKLTQLTNTLIEQKVEK